jgi:UDP-N-acetylmuramyl pentapeptide phosphotransferase/UDP-N-acetylglucosamine-1-phosphate transferase
MRYQGSSLGLLVTFGFVFLTSAWMVAGTIRVARALGVGIDGAPGVQRTHSYWVPRLGGVPIFFALFTGFLLYAWLSGAHARDAAFLIVASVPAFAIGLLEDLIQRVSASVRLVFTALAAALGWWLLDARLEFLDFAPLDPLLHASSMAAFAMTVFAATGVANAVNIVDGANGLSSFVTMVALACVAGVAFVVGDDFVASAATLGVAALLGFFIWNFPNGRIFMGDSGAYLAGFVVAELSILLVRHNPQVSPWFPMLVMCYPVTETLYSMYRRAFVRGLSMGAPERLHLHQLVYHRLVRAFPQASRQRDEARRSSVSATYLWALTLLCALPALLFWDSGLMLKSFCLLFFVSYHFFHRSLVKFRAPRALVLHRLPLLPRLLRRPVQPASAPAVVESVAPAQEA